RWPTARCFLFWAWYLHRGETSISSCCCCCLRIKKRSAVSSQYLLTSITVQLMTRTPPWSSRGPNRCTYTNGKQCKFSRTHKTKQGLIMFEAPGLLYWTGREGITHFG
ncbi:unnamed protein product, partial [Ectocarpus sp. 12 AP-2014]